MSDMKYLNPIMNVNYYTGGARDSSEKYRIENALDVKPMSQHKTSYGSLHVLSLKSDVKIRLSQFVIRNDFDPEEYGSRIKNGVIFVSEEPIPYEKLQQFSQSTENKSKTIQENLEEFLESINYKKYKHHIFSNMYNTTIGYNKFMNDQIYSGHYVTIWTVDSSFFIGNLDIEYIGLFGSLEDNGTISEISNIEATLIDIINNKYTNLKNITELNNVDIKSSIDNDKNERYRSTFLYDKYYIETKSDNSNELNIDCSGKPYSPSQCWEIKNVLDPNPYINYASEKGSKGFYVRIKSKMNLNISHFVIRNKLCRYPAKRGLILVTERDIEANILEDILSKYHNQNYSDTNYEEMQKSFMHDISGLIAEIDYDFMFETNNYLFDYEIEVVSNPKSKACIVEGKYVTVLIFDSWDIGDLSKTGDVIELEFIGMVGTVGTKPMLSDFSVGTLMQDKFKGTHEQDPLNPKKVQMVLDSFYRGDPEDEDRIDPDQVHTIIYSLKDNVDLCMHLIRNMTVHEKAYFFGFVKNKTFNFMFYVEPEIAKEIYGTIAFSLCNEEDKILKKSTKEQVEIVYSHKADLNIQKLDVFKTFSNIPNEGKIHTKEYRKSSLTKFMLLDFYYIFYESSMNVYYNAGFQAVINAMVEKLYFARLYQYFLVLLESVIVVFIALYSVDYQVMNDTNKELDIQAYLRLGKYILVIINIWYIFIELLNIVLLFNFLKNKSSLKYYSIYNAYMDTLADSYLLFKSLKYIYGIWYAFSTLNTDNITERLEICVYCTIMGVWIMKAMRNLKEFGPYIRTLRTSIYDIGIFLFLQLLITAGFSLIFYVMYAKSLEEDPSDELGNFFRADNIEQFGTYGASAFSMYKFAFLGDFDMGLLENTIHQPLATVFFLMSSLIVTVVALNALIAILGETHNSTMENAIGHQYREKLYQILETNIYNILYYGFVEYPLYLLGRGAGNFPLILLDEVYVKFDLMQEENYGDEEDDQRESWVKSLKNHIDSKFDKLNNTKSKVLFKINKAKSKLD